MKSSLRSVALLLPTLVVVAACASAPGEAVGSSNAAIINGEVDLFDAPVGLVAFDNPSYNWCTGTLIAPNIVLTAAHCLQDITPGSLSFSIGEGTAEPYPLPATPQSLTLNTYAVNGYAQDPQFVLGSLSGPSNFDVGLLHLKTPVTTTTPASFGTVAPVVGQAGRGVGYGKYLTLQTVGPGTAGQRREATMAIASVGTDTFVASPNSGNPSSGDSGGPFFVDGAIIGTVSAPPVGPITSPITNETYARLDVVYAWVNQQIATWQTTLPVTLPQIVISNGYFALSSGATNVAIGQIDTGVGWAKPASVTVTIDPTSLPSGITMSFTETIGYIPPVQGVAGGFEVSAAASVAPGTQATARVIVSDGVTSVTVTVEILVTDEPCVPQSCGNQCGVVANGCSGTMTCGCGTNETCESGECVAHGITCKAPLHNCGGYCARVCG